MASIKSTFKTAHPQLLFVGSNPKMDKMLDEAMEILDANPKICELINADQDRHGLQKKLGRELDKRYLQQKNPALLQTNEDEGRTLTIDDLTLQQGRPRMAPAVLFIFLILEGAYGSLYRDDVYQQLADSVTLRLALGDTIPSFPSQNTLGDNIGALSEKTLRFILDCQLAYIRNEGLDDFKMLVGDSTAVEANSTFPTDSSLIFRFLRKAFDYGQILDRFGLSNFTAWHVPRWLEEMKHLCFEIDTAKGSKTARKIRRKAYKRLHERAHQIINYLSGQLDMAEKQVCDVELRPTVHQRRENLLMEISEALVNALSLVYVSQERIANKETPVKREAHEEVYSISDPSARLIVKGGRDTTLGYKPQLAQSENCFITALLVDQGNTSDSASMKPLVEEHIALTKVTPRIVSLDDGYASAKGRASLQDELEIQVVSINGSKGKKLTPVEEWESDVYRQSRLKRPSIESSIFVLKYGFDFGTLRRRGLSSVRCELFAKVIAYNLNRIGQVRQAQRDSANAA